MSKRRVIRKVKNKRPYKCEKCNKAFTEERYLNSHQTKTPNCTTVNQCSKCHKSFQSPSRLKSHMDRITPCAPASVPVIELDNPTNKCHICGNEFSSKYVLKRHLKETCTQKVENMQIIMEKLKADLVKDIVGGVRAEISTQPTVVNNTYVQNNNVNVNIVFVDYGKEDLSAIDVQEIKRLVMSNAQEFIPRMIESIHANPDLPFNHNVYVDSPHGDAMVFVQKDGTMTWQLRDMQIVSRELTDKVKGHVINNQELNGLFADASTDDDWAIFADRINVIHGITGDEPELVEANRRILMKAKPMVEQVHESTK